MKPEKFFLILVFLGASIITSLLLSVPKTVSATEYSETVHWFRALLIAASCFSVQAIIVLLHYTTHTTLVEFERLAEIHKAENPLLRFYIKCREILREFGWTCYVFAFLISFLEKDTDKQEQNLIAWIAFFVLFFFCFLLVFVEKYLVDKIKTNIHHDS